MKPDHVTIVCDSGEHFRGTWNMECTMLNTFALDLEEESLFSTVFIPRDKVRFVLIEKPKQEQDNDVPRRAKR